VKPSAAVIERWADHPADFFGDNFNAKLDGWQQEGADAYSAHVKRMRLLLKACAGPGKSFLVAGLAWNFLSCFGGRGAHPCGALVSETEKMLHSTLWAEMARLYSLSPYLQATFEMSSERIFAKGHKDTWFLDARSWPRGGTDDELGRTLSGIHGPYVFFGIDECGLIPPAVARAANQAFVDRDLVFGRIIAAGNPLSRKGLLYDAAVQHPDEWRVITITGDPEDPRCAPRVDKDENAKNIREYGRDNPWVKAYILGEFPDADFNALLSPEQIEAAMRRAPRPEEYSFAAKVLGVDVALQGDDRTVICRRQGSMVWPLAFLRGATPGQIAARVAAEWTRWGADACFVDDTGGYGSGVTDALRLSGFRPIGVQFAGKATDERYANIRSEMHFKLAEAVKGHLALPAGDTVLVRELSTPTYTLRAGRFALEEKLQIKKRLGSSPDAADALALTFAHEVAPRRNGPGGMARGPMKVKVPD